jgi:hypothetical protein
MQLPIGQGASNLYANQMSYKKSIPQKQSSVRDNHKARHPTLAPFFWRKGGLQRSSCERGASVRLDGQSYSSVFSAGYSLRQFGLSEKMVGRLPWLFN